MSWFWLLEWICSPSPMGFLHLLGPYTFSPHWPFCILISGPDGSALQVHGHPFPSLGSPSHLVFLEDPVAPPLFPSPEQKCWVQSFPPYKAKPLLHHPPSSLP